MVLMYTYLYKNAYIMQQHLCKCSGNWDCIAGAFSGISNRTITMKMQEKTGQKRPHSLKLSHICTCEKILLCNITLLSAKHFELL